MNKGKFFTKVSRFKGVVYYESNRKRFRGRPERCFYIRYKDGKGKRIIEKIGWESEGITAAYAAQVRAERIRTLRLGDEPIPIQKKRKLSVTFEEVFEGHYLPWARQNKKSWQREEALYKCHLKPTIGNKPLREITPFVLEGVKKRMRERGLSQRTVLYALAVVRQVFNRARDWGLFEGEPPTKQVKMPRFDNRRIRFLSPEEIRVLLEACRKRSRELYEMCLLSLHCGLRAGEIFSLKWGDIDLTNGLLYVVDSKNRINRAVPMTEEVKKIFEGKVPGEPGDLVFPSRKGEERQRISRTFQRVLDELGWNEGVEDRRNRVTFHTLRHTFCALHVMAGTSLSVLAELLGHRSLEMVKRYSHLLPEARREAAKRLEEVLKTEAQQVEAEEEGAKKH